MNCPKCGNILNQNETLCRNCGMQITQIPNSNMFNINPNINQNNYNQYNNPNTIQEQNQQNNNMPNNLYNQNIPYNQQQLNQITSNNNYTTPNQNQVKEEKKKKSPLLKVLLIILVLVSAFAGWYWYNELFVNKNTNKNEENEDINIDEQTTKNVSINNYQLIIPDNYEYNTNQNQLIINNNEYLFILVPTNIKYTDIKTNIDDIKEKIEKDKVIIENNTDNIKNYNNSEYIIFNGKYNDINVNYFYTSIDDNNLLQGIIFKNDNIDNFETGYSYLDNIIKTISTIDSNNNDSTYSKDKLGIGELNIEYIKEKISNNIEEETVDTNNTEKDM